jgi:hypothetical protein
MALGQAVSPSEYVTLDDGTLWSTIEAWERDAQDPVLRDISARLRTRSLFKTATLDDEDAERSSELFEALKDIVARAGFDPRYYAALDIASTSVFDEPVDPADALYVCYHRRAPRLLSRTSLLLNRLAGERLVARRLVFPAEVRDAVGQLLGRSPQLALALPS